MFKISFYHQAVSPTHLHVAFVIKSFATEFAFKWLQTHVDIDVTRQVLLIPVHLLADVALVQSDVCPLLDVLFHQRVRLGEVILVHEDGFEFLFAVITWPAVVDDVGLAVVVHARLQLESFTTNITDKGVALKQNRTEWILAMRVINYLN